MFTFRLPVLRFLAILLAFITGLAQARADSFTVKTNSFIEGVNGGSDSVVLTDHPGFPFNPFWTASSTNSWVTWNTSSGSGNATVNFTFTQNPGPGSRVGNLTIGGVTISVNQAGPSSYSLGTSNLVEGSAAGIDSVRLTVSSNPYPWIATTTNSWLHPVVTSGTGSTNLAFNFDANPDSTRTGTLTLGGQTLTVTQAGVSYVTAGTVATLFSSGLSSPGSVAVDATGYVYFSDTDYKIIYKGTVGTGNVTNLFSFGLKNPYGVAVDGAGNVYFSDTDYNIIYKVSVDGGFQSVLVSSGFFYPHGVTVDVSGNVYIADTYNNVIKKWNAANSNLTTLVSFGLNSPYGVAVDVSGNVYIADTYSYAIKKWNVANSNLTTLVSFGLNRPAGVTVDVSGNVYIADTYNNAIKKWNAANSNLTTLVSFGLERPSGVAVDVSGNIYIADTFNNAIKELPKAFLVNSPRFESAFSGNDSLPAIVPATLNLSGPFQPTSDQPWLTITSTNNGVVSYSFTANPGSTRRTAHISVLGQSVRVTQLPALSLGTSSLTEGQGAGADTVVLAAASPSTQWTAVASAPWLHIATTVASGSGIIPFTFDANPGGPRIGTISLGGQTLTVTQAGSRYVPAGRPTTIGGLFSPNYSSSAGGVSVDASGNVYAPDGFTGYVRKWSPGTTSNAYYTLQYPNGNSINPASLALDPAGNVLILDVQNGVIGKWDPVTGNVNVLVTSGIGLATAGGAWGQLAGDALGNVYLADAPNNAIEKYVAATGDWVTHVTGLNQPYGVAVDAAGNLYIADTYNNTVKTWRADTGLTLPLVTNNLSHPLAVAVDGSGNVYIADSGNNAIKKWTASSGMVSTLATGLTGVNGVTVDTLGNVYASLPQATPVVELPQAYVDTTTRFESAAGGTDLLPTVLPAAESLLLPFAPNIDTLGNTKWVTNWTVSNSAIRVYFGTNNTSAFQTNYLYFLGTNIALIQNWAVPAPASLMNPVSTGTNGGGMVIRFTNYPGAAFTLWSTTNLSLPFSQWYNEGAPSNTTGNLFEFTDTTSTNSTQKFYRVTTP